VLPLGFGRSRFRFAARPGTMASVEDLAGKRISTSYVGVVRRYLEEHGIDAEVVRLDGAVESSIQLGVADVIADVVETGSTLKAAGLEIAGEVILESEAVLITRADAPDPNGFEVFKRRIDGVLVARTYVMMDYDMPDERIEEAVALTPGLEGPTISPLHREGWVAVRAMVPRAGAQKLMDDLYEIGARAILLTDIHACRL
jgi:ATP phosphoribosyltransferase